MVLIIIHQDIRITRHVWTSNLRETMTLWDLQTASLNSKAMWLRVRTGRSFDDGCGLWESWIISTNWIASSTTSIAGAGVHHNFGMYNFFSYLFLKDLGCPVIYYYNLILCVSETAEKKILLAERNLSQSSQFNCILEAKILGSSKDIKRKHANHQMKSQMRSCMINKEEILGFLQAG